MTMKHSLKRKSRQNFKKNRQDDEAKLKKKKKH